MSTGQRAPSTSTTIRSPPLGALEVGVEFAPGCIRGHEAAVLDALGAAHVQPGGAARNRDVRPVDVQVEEQGPLAGQLLHGEALLHAILVVLPPLEEARTFELEAAQALSAGVLPTGGITVASGRPSGFDWRQAGRTTEAGGRESERPGIGRSVHELDPLPVEVGGERMPAVLRGEAHAIRYKRVLRGLEALRDHAPPWPRVRGLGGLRRGGGELGGAGEQESRRISEIRASNARRA